MHPHDVFAVHRKNGKFTVIEAKDDAKFVVMGKSPMETLYDSKSNIPVNSIMVDTMNKSGILAIKITQGKYAGSSFFLFLKTDKDYPSNANAWFPGNKMVQISKEGIEVEINDEKFTSNPDYLKKPGKRYVDPDFLCHYIYDFYPMERIIDDDIVNAAAEEIKKMEAEEELANL